MKTQTNSNVVIIPLIAIMVSACVSDPELVYKRFSPMVVSETRTDDVVLIAKIEGEPDEVRLELQSSGTEIQLLDDGSGVDAVADDGEYSVSILPADYFFNFDPDDVNRNFVGRLNLYLGGTQLSSSIVIGDVLTPDIPPVSISTVSSTTQYSKHLVNIVYPGFFTELDSEDSWQAVAQAFYAEFPDRFDFLNIISDRSFTLNRGSRFVSGNVENIGTPLSSQASAWGSEGRLLGVHSFPIPTFFDGAEPGYLHELGHHWVNFLMPSPLNQTIPHWPISDLASGIMGWGTGRNTQGLDFNYDLEPEAGNYRLVINNEPKHFTDLSLYLMGLAPADEVGEHFVFDDQSQSVSDGGLLRGPVTSISMDDIVAAMGTRIPDYSRSPKKFRIATILVTKDRLASVQAMQLYDYFSTRAQGSETVRFSSGLAQGTSNPFYLATRERGRLDHRIVHNVLVDASRDGGVWWFPQSERFDPSAAHQGKPLADYLRLNGYKVDELARGSNVASTNLPDYDIVIRVLGFSAYSTAEIAAYQEYVRAGGRLLLLSDHSTNAPDDALAQSFGVQFGGITRGRNLLSEFSAHSITESVEPLSFNVGSGLLDYPASAQIIGSLSADSYLDLNFNGTRESDEPTAPEVLGVMPFGDGQIVFCSDTNLWLSHPQPLFSNLLRWFEYQ